MSHHRPDPEHLFLSRREFLQRCGIGMGALGFAMLSSDGRAARAAGPGSPPHFPAKAKRVIHIFANGGP
ncbi:MAG: twin-arginine translocation signal domain-containing protein, partial [Opitutaceae bacterium]